MTDDVKRFFHNIRKRVAGLNCIIITDRDGVPLMKFGDDKSLGMIMKPSFHTTFTMATEQSNKLGLGRNRNIISVYTGYQVVQMNKLPLLVTFIGTESCNIGHILALDQQIELVLDEVKVAVTET